VRKLIHEWRVLDVYERWIRDGLAIEVEVKRAVNRLAVAGFQTEVAKVQAASRTSGLSQDLIAAIAGLRKAIESKT
jgi:ABC-type uncharacterized transport system YnjBCD substrate-binding protein